MDYLPKFGWGPLTPRGVAVFARAKLGRLFLVQFLVALLVAAAVAWLLSDAFFPTIRTAIDRLPEAGEIRGSRLQWSGASPVLLAEGRCLALSVDLNFSGEVRSPAHLQLEFGRENVSARSLFGYAEVKYPAGWIIAFNRTELIPKWGAWKAPLLAVAVGGVVVYLLACWSLLATLCAGPVWLLAFFANRELTLRGSWKLAGAALMPGALFVAAGVLLYDSGVVDLVGLAFVVGAHLVLDGVYLIASPFFLPRLAATEAARKNPFSAAKNP